MATHPFARIVLAHLARYPLMQPDDLYKLAHQAALGSEHAVSSEARARTWLERELIGMGGGPPEPLLDPISADGRILRVHLRPFIQEGCGPDALLRAFIQTASQVKGSPQDLRTNLATILGLAQSGKIGFQEGDLRALFTRMESAGWPARRHSDAYTRAYKPAYRVVSRVFLPARLPG